MIRRYLQYLLITVSTLSYASNVKVIKIDQIDDQKVFTEKAQPHKEKASKDESVQVKSREKVTETYAMIKPDAVQNGHTGDIIKLIEANKFSIIGIKKVQLTQHQAMAFYKEHQGKSFFKDLIAYMTSGPIIALVLQKKDAVASWRNLMGATNPLKSDVGSLRYMFGSSMTENAVHGSDSEKSARREIKFFFGV
jgi:nucleoside-diphosphate kinase